MYVSDYAEAVTDAGGLPVHLPQHVDPADYVGRLDGLLLSGGADVQPSLYGAERETDLYPPEPLRDRLELGLIERRRGRRASPCSASAAACSCSTCGPAARCTSTCPTHARYDVPPDDARRRGRPSSRGTRLDEMYGARPRVNSLHHQTVDRVADGWVVAARSADGTVEALEWPGHDVIAVQWHPELLPGARTDPLFAWLVERAGARRAPSAAG